MSPRLLRPACAGCLSRLPETMRRRPISVDGCRVAHPLFQAEGDGSSPISTLQTSDLLFEPCSRPYAIRLNELWHSRMPLIDRVGIQFAFHAVHGDISYAVAIWSPPIARMLPSHWLELRRMACSPEMPRNGASSFLGWMARYFKKEFPAREKLISYQDTSVHSGTIYRAAGWVPARTSRDGDSWDKPARQRENINGPVFAPKIRWEKPLT